MLVFGFVIPDSAREITWDNRNELKAGDVLLQVWRGVGVTRSACVVQVHAAYPSPYNGTNNDAGDVFCIDFGMAPRKFIPSGYDTCGGGGSSLCSKPPNYPHRFFLLGHEDFVADVQEAHDRLQASLKGNPAYDLMM